MSTREWDAISAFVQVVNANGWPQTPSELDALDADDAAFIVLFEADAMITNGGFGGL